MSEFLIDTSASSSAPWRYLLWGCQRPPEDIRLEKHLNSMQSELICSTACILHQKLYGRWTLEWFRKWQSAIVFTCKLDVCDVYETQQNFPSVKEGTFPFYILLGLIIKTNSHSNINIVEVSNWQEIKEMVISFLTIVPFIPLADLSCQNKLLVWQHSSFPEPVPEC